LLFAPVRFGPQFFAAHRPFVPEFVVRADFLFGSLFVGPKATSFFFGDFFEPRFASTGFVPWVDFRVGRTAFDPNFSYFRQSHVTDPKWEAGLRDLYRARATGEVARPPHTWAQQSQMLTTLSADRSGTAPVRNNINLTRTENVTALAPIKDVNNSK